QQLAGLVHNHPSVVHLKRYAQERDDEITAAESQLEGMRAQVNNLRGQLEAYGEKFELIQKQVIKGKASRGLPDNPTAAADIAKAQLGELLAMEDGLWDRFAEIESAAEKGQEWAEAEASQLRRAAAIAAATAGHPVAVSLQTVEEEANRAMEGTLSSLLYVLEEMQAVESAANDRMTREEADGLIQDIQDTSRLRRDKEVDRAFREIASRVDRLVSQEVVSSLQAGDTREAKAFVEGRAKVGSVEEATELVDAEVETFSSGGTGMPDLAAIRSGGQVVYGNVGGGLLGGQYGGEIGSTLGRALGTALSTLTNILTTTTPAGRDDGDQGRQITETGTSMMGMHMGMHMGVGAALLSPSEALTSPSLTSSTLPWADYLLHALRVPGRSGGGSGHLAEGPEAALSADFSTPGSCFAFRGQQGRITVRLAERGGKQSPGGGEA
ncbi:unnamed protein product, partial [Discosporangium mesarthrocarpum]